MRIDMQQRRLGKLLLVGLALAVLNSCRNSQPPAIEICLGDGVGGADCVEADGSKKYRVPSELKNYWLTNPPDMKNFSSWCYQASAQTTKSAMNVIMEEARRDETRE